jgi:DNA-binding MarR family transcriptional regulator
MKKEPKKKTGGLINQIVRKTAAMRMGMDELEECAAAYLRINRIDLRCLQLLRQQTMIAGDLAQAAHLAPATLTTVIGRLKKAGYVRSQRNAVDHRSVKLALTVKANRSLVRIWGPVARDERHGLAKYTTPQLLIVRYFIEETTRLHRQRVDKMTIKMESSFTSRSGRIPKFDRYTIERSSAKK